MVIFWWLGRPVVSMAIQGESLEGTFLAIAGESAKSSKILPLLNFAPYGIHLNTISCIQDLLVNRAQQIVNNRQTLN